MIEEAPGQRTIQRQTFGSGMSPTFGPEDRLPSAPRSCLSREQWDGAKTEAAVALETACVAEGAEPGEAAPPKSSARCFQKTDSFLRKRISRFFCKKDVTRMNSIQQVRDDFTDFSDASSGPSFEEFES